MDGGGIGEEGVGEGGNFNNWHLAICLGIRMNLVRAKC